ncbi:MAG: adenylyl-sulfate kinase [Candidatus Hydrogenedentes bacterium]|nr:adenylyl-sulfate kinase [Candidatus Hydrogenedentota bacterium]
MNEKASNNLTWHPATVGRAEREALNGHRGAVLWFTGYSGSGKSTVANATASKLHERGKHTYLLDGDNVRLGLNRDLGFSAGDREENIRRIGEVAQLFADAGLIVLTAFISPYRADRARVRETVGAGFVEVYVRCDLAVCEARDPKGLYRKARAGEIGDFTGITSPYEEPERPELIVDTTAQDPALCADAIVAYLERAGIV